MLDISVCVYGETRENGGAEMIFHTSRWCLTCGQRRKGRIPEISCCHFRFPATHVSVVESVEPIQNQFRAGPQPGNMLEQLGLVGTIRDEDQSPEEPDSESEQEVSAPPLRVALSAFPKQRVHR